MTTLVESASPLATPCKNADVPIGVWLQAAGKTSVDETPSTASRLVMLITICFTVSRLQPLAQYQLDW